ncbi:ANTAR domain-containing protein [Streptomyces sp. SS1-1]|nr:ANTAR domain-containing protein [Streptomyces sp. SS1-1]
MCRVLDLARPTATGPRHSVQPEPLRSLSSTPGVAPKRVPGTRRAHWRGRGARGEDGAVTPHPNEPPDDSARITELEEEVDQLRHAVGAHAVVDQAIGMVVALGRVAPDQGWAVLKDVSQHTNIKLREVAELIIVWGREGEMPAEIRVELQEALERHGPTQIPESGQD